jgi:hypothetical protein
MVGMTMCDQNGIEPFQPKPQGLLAKIGRSIDQNGLARVLYDY